MTHFRLARNILLAGLLLNVVYCLVATYLLNWPYPHTTFLFRPYDRFADLYAVLRATVDLDPYQIRRVDIPGHGPTEVSNYFPFTHILFYPLTFLTWEQALYVLTAVPLAFFTYAYARIAKAANVGWKEGVLSYPVFVPLNYPILFTFDRGNIDSWTFSFVAIGVYFFARRKFHASAFWISLGGCIKLLPLVFLFPLFIYRRWAAVGTATITTAAVTLASLACFDGGIPQNLDSMRTAFLGFSEFLLLGVNVVTHSLGLFSAGLAIATFTNNAYLDAGLLGEVLYWYNRAGFAVLLGLLVYLWRARLEDWRCWILLTGAFLILPVPSYDYRMLYLLIPLTYAILKPEVPKKYVWLLALILVPKVVPFYNDVRISVLINPLLIVVLMVMTISEPRTTAAVATDRKYKRNRRNTK